MAQGLDQTHQQVTVWLPLFSAHVAGVLAATQGPSHFLHLLGLVHHLFLSLVHVHHWEPWRQTQVSRRSLLYAILQSLKKCIQAV